MVYPRRIVLWCAEYGSYRSLKGIFNMFKRLEIKKFFALLMVACLLLAGVMAMPATAYADPEDDPAVTEQVTEGTQEDGEAAEGAAAQPSATQEGATVSGSLQSWPPGMM